MMEFMHERERERERFYEKFLFEVHLVICMEPQAFLSDPSSIRNLCWRYT